MQLRHAFTIAFLAGSIVFLYVFLFKSDEPVLQLLAVPIVVIYGLYVLFSHKDNIGSANSVYYIGFIFTLQTLFVSLLPMVTDPHQISPGPILASFSVALSTTLAGLILRMFIVQYRLNDDGSSAGASANNANKQFVEEVNGLVITLASITGVLDNFKSNLTVSIGGIQKKLENLTHETMSQQESFTKNVLENMEHVIEQFSINIEQSLEKTDKFRQKILHNNVEGLKENEKSIKNMLTALNSGIMNFSKTMNTVNKDLVNNQSLAAKKLEEVTIESMEHVEKHAQSSINEVSKGTQQKIGDLIEILPDYEKEILKFSTTINAVNNDLVKNQSIAANKLEEVTIESMEHVGKHAKSTINEISNGIQQQIDDLVEMLPDYKSAGKNLVVEVSGLSKSLSIISKSTEDIVKLSNEMGHHEEALLKYSKNSIDQIGGNAINQLKIVTKSLPDFTKSNLEFELAVKQLVAFSDQTTGTTNIILELEEGLTNFQNVVRNLNKQIENYANAGDNIQKVSISMRESFIEAQKVYSELNKMIIDSSSIIVHHINSKIN